ncbi:MAG: tRNA 2-thiouridine(34) synthase MnmA [Deltaproteobacteria bacterium]|nr:tRNA 2-thiouridine(34) synthase MnmA [Deltaproteobacteria bacterium]
MIVVAMSGGVDSSVAAGLLSREGHEVVGIHLRLADAPDRPEDAAPRACCAPQDAHDVRKVAARLGLDHYVLDYRERFEAEVIEPFVEAYAAGHTPNPCLQCNSEIKFGPLLEQARRLGAEELATGHYARIRRDAQGRLHLHRGRDPGKDQSYFLYRLDQPTLARLRFPLGELRKEEVRELARGWGLNTAEKLDSQEICFVGREGYARLVEARLGPQASGTLVDEAGRVLGEHEGLHRFTIGQRKGLGLGGGDRRYVTRIEPASGRVVVGPRSALARRKLRLGELSWIAGEPPALETPLEVHVRYRDRGRPGVLEGVEGDEAVARLEEAVEGAAPGQAVVFYDGDELLGGGTLLEAKE